MTQNTPYTWIAGGLVFIGATFFLASYYVEEQQKDIIDKITIEILEQEKILSNIAEITDRNGADAVVESIVVDCKPQNRVRFEELLNNLNALNASELKEIDSLFDACANFFAQRKATMVARMEREFEVFSDLVSLLSIVDDTIAVSKYKVTEWQSLMTLEKKRSDIFNEQVIIQKDIISALQNGELVSSENISRKLVDAQNVQEEAVVVNQQIDELRSALLAI